MKTTKEKIRSVVADYIKLYGHEYKLFLQSTRAKEEVKKDKYGTMEKMVQRHLYDIPLTLHNMLKNKLEQEEWYWFTANDIYQGKWDGVKWFIKEFPQFSRTNSF